MKIGLIGFGSIGRVIARNFRREIAWVADADARAEKLVKSSGLSCPFYTEIPEKCGGAELVVEAASQQAVPSLAGCLKHSDIMIMSVGALADRRLLAKLVGAAERHGRRIYLPSGAIGGLDAISSVGAGATRILLETTKPPKSLGRNDSKRTVVFEGTASRACRLYPKNVNVSATLALAGAGFEKTRVRIVSDPGAERNVHRIFVESAAGSMCFAFENAPSKENPKTSLLAALSAVNRIRKIKSAVQIG